MVTNPLNWLPLEKCRICNDHLTMDNHKEDNKRNKLKLNACAMASISNKAHGDKETTIDLDLSDVSSTSDVNTEEILNMSFNDNDSILSDNFSNEDSSLDTDYLSLLSYPEYNLDHMDIEESAPEFDAVSLCSSLTNVRETIQSHEKCAVLLCDENIRKQFGKLLFFDFPKHNKELCNIWWKMCGRDGKFDPTSKLCSIHFDANNFKNISLKQNGQLYEKTILKMNAIPNRYLQSQEYLKFANKRKKIDCELDKLPLKRFLYDSQVKYNSHTDILDNNDIEESQSKQNNSTSLMKQYKHIESFEKEIASDMVPNENSNNNDCDMKYFNLFNKKNVKEAPKNKKNNLRTVEHNKTELTLKTNESNLKSVPENITNAITLDYMSSTKCTSMLPKKSQRKSQNNFEGILQSILHCQELTECHDKMRPSNCDQDCQFICHHSIPSCERREIYKKFQINNKIEQNCEITQLVLFPENKNNIYSFESCPSYHLIVNKKLAKVCRSFFLSTLGLTEKRLNAILKPDNYRWYSDSDRALKAMKQLARVDEPIFMTDFIKESSILLEKDYYLFEPDSDPEVSLENVSSEEWEKVMLYMKSIPRILSTYQQSEESEKKIFMTSICWEYIYKTYSENYNKNKISVPLTSRQFKRIYNQYMKKYLIIV